MRIIIILIVWTLILFSCKQTNEDKREQLSEQDTTIIDSSKIELLPPLPEGTLNLTNKDFGKTIELQGTSHPVNQVFKISECEMIALDSVLILKNINNSELFNIFSLPDFKFIKSFGKTGKGPGEFQFPSLIQLESDSSLCYIYEKTDRSFYLLNRNLELKKIPLNINKTKRKFSDKQFCGLSSNEFFYVESIKMGKAIFHLELKNNTATTTLVKKLAFSDKHKNWAAYIGDFGANEKNKRLVFAYKYFKRLVFYDFENKTSRVISFNTSAKTKKGDPVSMLSSLNVTHYWGMSAQDKYVYVLYSGRTPIDVSKELSKSSGYIYIEKFDWNGNPICRYKLNKWGYFCVNKKENMIYLASTTDEQPFVSFELPAD